MKKVLLSLIVILTVLSSYCFANADSKVTERPDISIVIDGKLSTFTEVPIEANDRTLLPLRAVLTSLGVQNDNDHIIWNGSDSSVTIVKDSRKIFLKVNSLNATVNGTVTTLDVAPVEYKDRVYIPARFVAQSLGKKVIWDEGSRTIAICDEQQFSRVKELLSKSENAMSDIKKYKVSQLIKVAESSMNIALEVDRTKNNLHLSAIGDQSNGPAIVEDFLEIYCIGETSYAKDKNETEWTKFDTAEGDFESHIRMVNTSFGMGLRDYNYACLTFNEKSDSNEYILEGDFIAPNSGASDKKGNFYHVKIVIDKNTNYYKTTTLQDEIVSNSLQGGKMQELMETNYSEVEGNFEIALPQNMKIKSESTPTKTNNSNTIKIGAILPVSGQIAAYGELARDGVQLAVDEINAKGGILGKKIELIVEDDEANPEKTVNAFKKLTKQDNIVGIIGALTSKCSLSITQYAQAQKIIMITPTSTNDAVTSAGNFIFRACYNDSYQGQGIAKFSIETLKAKKAAILFDNTNDYSKSLRDNFKKKFEELGGNIVAEESYAAMDKDFNSQLAKIKGTNPGVLFIPDYYTTVSLIAKQVKRQGINVPMLGADGWDEITFSAGDEIIGSYYSNHFSPNNPDQRVQKFVNDYYSKYNIKPDVLAALNYDAAYILADAIQRAGSIDPDKIQAEMMKTNGKYLTGNLKFDQNRNPIKSLVMLKIQKIDKALEAVFNTIVEP
ncbi:MAG: ABC transporter substrate-binding protein [Clostridia bacterium]|nr:ABC transporter substrate-binding protein [Clostridia bacterium]